MSRGDYFVVSELIRKNKNNKKNNTNSHSNLTIIELAMWPRVWPCVWQPTHKTADVNVTKIAGYVRVRILMNRYFFLVFLAFIVFTLRPLC